MSWAWSTVAAALLDRVTNPFGLAWVAFSPLLHSDVPGLLLYSFVRRKPLYGRPKHLANLTCWPHVTQPSLVIEISKRLFQ